MSKILVIEDEALLLEEVVEILTFEGFEVYGAENGAIGIERVYQHWPDIILCDIMMPRMDGYQVLMNLQSDARTRLIPFLFTTAKSSVEDIRTGMSLGADDYLTKPFSRDQLVQAINARLEKRRVVADLIDQSREQITHLQNTIMITLPHELRTPLSSISGYSEILAEDIETMTTEQVQTMVNGVRRGAQRLHRLIENYLLYAQLEIKRYQREELDALIEYYRANPIQVSEIVESVAQQKADHYDRSADLHLTLQTDLVPLPFDEVKKIVAELTDNAFKFSEAGTPVTVAVHATEEGVSFIVQDHGRGMTAEQIEQIGAYMQFDRKLYEQQGLGLGLTLARMLVHLFEGNLVIQSEPETGTTVTVSFRIA